QTLVRLLAYSYTAPRPDPEKRLVVGLGIGLMKTVALLAESAARRPAGPTHPGVNGGVSVTAPRHAAAVARRGSSPRVLVERLGELAKRAGELDQIDQRISNATGLLQALAERAEESLHPTATTPRVLADA